VTSIVVSVVLVASVLAAGAVLASPGRATPSASALALGGRAPTSVELSVSIATGSDFRASGTLWLDTRRSSMRAQLQVPLVASSTRLELRALDGRLYVTSPNLATASGPVWYHMATAWPSLAGLAGFLAAPDPTVLAVLANKKVTHSRGTTTYEGTRSHLALQRFGAASGAGLSGELDVRLTTGRQGQFTGVWARLDSPAGATTLDLQVLAYNLPVSIVAPPASRSTAPAGPLITQLLRSGALGTVMVPTQLMQLLGRVRRG
jgi:hypothetical protein